MTNLGHLGEQFVCSYLQSQGGTILQKRWRCRGGEIDIIALWSDLIFVEVKTRSQGNWDENGALAIDRKKQAKIGETAQYFLSEFPEFSEFSCRFDVALVKVKKSPLPSASDLSLSDKIELNQSVIWQGYQFILVEYLVSAFEM